MSRMRPPLTTSMTGPSTISSLSFFCFDRAPGALVLGALLREDEAAVLVLFREDQRLELLVERDFLGGVDVVADRELAGRDHAFGLVPDVEEDLVAVDLDDDASHDVTVVELDDRGVDGVGERLPVQVVEHDGCVGLALLGESVGVGGGECADIPCFLGDGGFDCLRHVLLRQHCSS